jgi:hypothetical protein
MRRSKMPRYRVKVKTVTYDWLTVNAPDEGSILKVVEGGDLPNGDDSPDHEAAWDGGEAADGPEDGHHIEVVVNLDLQ